ncbi:RDD family protein [Streptomyces sp. NPDC054863]
MSAPTPANGGHAPGHGFYPDPSIPGYVRYWNGSSWVPGTSRPAPAAGEPMPTPPPGAAPAPSPHSGLPNLASVPAPAPVGHTGPPVDETGPFFFDEEDEAGGPGQQTGHEVEVRRSAEPVVAWQADTSRQNGFGGERDRRVSWGSPPASGGPGGPGDAGAAPADGAAPGHPAASTPPGLTPAQGRAPSADPRAPGALPARAERPALESPPRPSPAPPHGRHGTPEPRREPRGQLDGPDSRGQLGSPESRGQQGSPDSRGQQGRAEGEWGIPCSSEAESLGKGGHGAAPGGAAPLATAPPRSGRATPTPPRTTGARIPDGTMSIRTVKPRQQSAPAAAHQSAPAQPTPVAPQQPSTPQNPLPGQGRRPTPPAASWAQQVNQLADAAAPSPTTPAPEAEGRPVVPWKPPVEDVFAKAAREQAAARPAGLGRRLAARLLDTVVLGAAVAAVAVPLVTQAVDHIDEKIRAAKLSGTTVTVYLLDATTVGFLGVILGTFLVLGVLYEAVPTAKWGRTLGKKAFGLQVRDIEEHEPPRFGGALRRWLVYGVLGILGVGVLNVLWCLVDRPWRQCWHDKAARTFVAGKS